MASSCTLIIFSLRQKMLLLCLAILGSIPAVHSQTIRYVKPNESGTGSGNSWANASDDLQLMINNSAYIAYCI